MPVYEYTCEVCGTRGRAWRPDGHPPRFCSAACRNRGLAGTRLRKGKWPITPQLHEQIRELYQNEVGMSKRAAVREFAAQVGYPAWKIIRYAMHHGWAHKRKAQPVWTEKELQILRYYAYLSPPAIRRHLQEHGFSRTEASIAMKRKRLRLTVRNLPGRSARQVAELFGVEAHTVARWISLGWLRAQKRQVCQHGDYYYIEDEWVRDFVVRHVDEIDLRKITDLYWFVHVLAANGQERRPGNTSPCRGCRWEKLDKSICAPECEKLAAWRRTEPRSISQEEDQWSATVETFDELVS